MLSALLCNGQDDKMEFAILDGRFLPAAFWRAAGQKDLAHCWWISFDLAFKTTALSRFRGSLESIFSQAGGEHFIEARCTYFVAPMKWVQGETFLIILIVIIPSLEPKILFIPKHI